MPFSGVGEAGNRPFFVAWPGQELDFVTNNGTIAKLEQSDAANPNSICDSLTPPYPAILQTVV